MQVVKTTTRPALTTFPLLGGGARAVLQCTIPYYQELGLYQEEMLSKAWGLWGYKRGGFLGFLYYWCSTSRMGRREQAEGTCQTRLHCTHSPNSQHQVRICKLLSVGLVVKAPHSGGGQPSGSPASFPFNYSTPARGDLASLAPQRKPRLAPASGITHRALGGFACRLWAKQNFSPSSPSFLDLIWVTHTPFPAQPHQHSDFAKHFSWAPRIGRAASSGPPTGLATPGAPPGPPPAPSRCLPGGPTACPGRQPLALCLTSAELRDAEAEPKQKPSSHRVLHDPVSWTWPRWSRVLAEGSVAEVAPQGSGRPHPDRGFKKMSSSCSVSWNKLSERTRKRGDPREECCFPFACALVAPGGGWAPRSGRRAQPLRRVGPGRGAAGGAGRRVPRARGPADGALGSGRCGRRLGCRLGEQWSVSWRGASKPAVGSALCTNRGGVRASLSLASARPPSAPPTPRPFLLAPSTSLPLFAPLLLSFFFFSVSEVAPSAGREEGDNCSHTLAPATTSEVPTVPVPSASTPGTPRLQEKHTQSLRCPWFPAWTL